METYYNISQDPSSDNLPLLLFTLSMKKPGSPLNASTINLISKILSTEDYIELAARIDHALDAKNMLDFIRHLLHYYSISNQDAATAEMSRRARQFMSEIVPRMHGLAPSNIPYNANNYTFPLLLSIINRKQPESHITSVVNGTTIEFTTDILFREDYIELAAQLLHLPLDAKNLLDFIPHVLHYYSISKQDPIKAEMKRRGRRLMLAIISILHGVPLSNISYDTLPLLLYILNNNKPISSAVNAFTTSLMNEILSRGDFIQLAAGLANPSDSRNLLYFMLNMICNRGISKWDSSVDITRRAIQFMLEIMSKMHVQPHTPRDISCHTFSLLLAILNNRKPELSITSPINITIAGFMCDILSRDDYLKFATRLHDTAGAKKLLDFLLDMLIHWRSLSSNLVTACRTRLFILEVISKISVTQGMDDLYRTSHPYLLYTLTHRKPELSIASALNATMADFMCDILSREDYIDFAAQVYHSSDAKCLLNFLLDILNHWYLLPYQGSTTVDIVQRARWFMLQVIPKTHAVQGPLETSHSNPHHDMFSLLLYILNHQKSVRSISIPFNNQLPQSFILRDMATEFMKDILSREDYVRFATRVDNASDAKNLLDLVHDPLRYRPGGLLKPINKRERRFVMNVISKMPVIPSSLIVTGVRMPVERDHVGSGHFGDVFKAELRGEVVALKVLSGGDYDGHPHYKFCREAIMWGSLIHEFLLPFYGIYEHDEGDTHQFFLISPYMQNGTLCGWRDHENPSIADIREHMLEVAHGLEYIHSEDVVHGDIHADNILLDNNSHVQIADFGLTHLSETTTARSGAVYPKCAAPELFEAAEDDNSSSDGTCYKTQLSDVYAFGCLYSEIHYGRIIYTRKLEVRTLSPSSRTQQEEQPLSDEAWDLIQQCQEGEPSKRPTMREVVERMIHMS